MKEKKLFFEVLTQDEAIEIAYNWKYDGELSFYNMTADEEDLVLFLDEEKRGQNTFSVRGDENQDVMAYFHYDLVDNSTAEIVLGVNPSYLNRGYGRAIIRYAEDALRERKGVLKMTLAVAQFNALGIQFYQRLGFVIVGNFRNSTNGGIFTFLKMEKNINGAGPSSS